MKRRKLYSNMKKLFAANTRASLLRDLVYSANDGVVTTFAIVAGSQGASLSNAVILVLGFANLFADGFSMASGNYLGVKTEVDYKSSKGEVDNDEGSPLLHGIVTFTGFQIAGIIPLLPFVFNFPGAFGVSTVFIIIVLLLVGAVRGWAVGKDVFRSAFEMLFVGGFAAVVAYVVGYLIENYVVMD